MVKSAFEIAMEKVANMPKIDAEAIKENKRKEVMAAGENLAAKMMKGTLRVKNLENELTKYKSEEREQIQAAFMKSLKEYISLESTATNQLVLETLKTLDEGMDLESVQGELNALIEEYLVQRNLEYAKSIKAEKEKLADLGISGSAVIPNIYDDPEWQESVENLQQSFQPRLTTIREKLPG